MNLRSYFASSTEAVDENDHIPDLQGVLREPTPRTTRSVKRPEDLPPPPGDWMSHPVTRAILLVILLGVIALLIWKATEWMAWIRNHPFGAGIAGLVIFGLVGVTMMSFFRYRAEGDLGQRYWDTGRKRKKR